MCDEVVTPIRDRYREDFITSPFRWFSNECQTIQLTSPFGEKDDSSARPIDPSAPSLLTRERFNLAVVTPPPPTPFGVLSVSRSEQQQVHHVSLSPNEEPVFLKLFGLYGCPATLRESLRRLGWAGEQVLCAPLERISHVLKKLELRCREPEWQELLRLRDAYLQCAVSYLETSFLVHTLTSYALPSSVNKLFDHFLQVSERIIQRLPEDVGHGPQSSSCPPLSANEALQLSSVPQKKLCLSPFPCSTALVPVSCDISLGKASGESNLAETSPNEERNQDSLLNRLVNVVRKQSIARLAQVLGQPIEGNAADKECGLTYYSSPVVRRAQKRLGDVWHLLGKFGVGQELHDAVRQRLYLSKPKASRHSCGEAKSLAARLSLKQKEQKKSGALALMGPRCSRKGRYVSRKNVQMKTKITKERNKQRRERLLQNVDPSLEIESPETSSLSSEVLLENIP